MMIWAKKSPHFREKYLVLSYLNKIKTKKLLEIEIELIVRGELREINLSEQILPVDEHLQTNLTSIWLFLLDNW